MNVYTAQFVRDMDGDGVLDVLTSHGGDIMSETGTNLHFTFISE